jgi:hypothetical protein
MAAFAKSWRRELVGPEFVARVATRTGRCLGSPGGNFLLASIGFSE